MNLLPCDKKIAFTIAKQFYLYRKWECQTAQRPVTNLGIIFVLPDVLLFVKQ